MEEQWYPLIYFGNAPNISGSHSSEDASQCYDDSLDPEKVKGKIVLCDAYDVDSVVLLAGDANKIKSYINSISSPLAKILRTVTPNGADAPIVAPFSSRGPSPVIKSLLKPDITAPGVNILAAW
ncbi:hypothetical protein SUGI_0861660 [Cryptomeria japonica]|nr:hypothetical protein SUGI_0861660 [Cryptomeria japonica]